MPFLRNVISYNAVAITISVLPADGAEKVVFKKNANRENVTYSLLPAFRRKGRYCIDLPLTEEFSMGSRLSSRFGAL